MDHLQLEHHIAISNLRHKQRRKATVEPWDEISSGRKQTQAALASTKPVEKAQKKWHVKSHRAPLKDWSHLLLLCSKDILSCIHSLISSALLRTESVTVPSLAADSSVKTCCGTVTVLCSYHCRSACVSALIVYDSLSTTSKFNHTDHLVTMSPVQKRSMEEPWTSDIVRYNRHVTVTETAETVYAASCRKVPQAVQQ